MIIASGSSSRHIQSLSEILVTNLEKKGFGKLYVGRTPIHMKEISVDSRYFLSGSNNWLSNKSFQNKESSLRIIDQVITKEIRDEAIISVRSNQIIPKIL